MIQFSEMRTRDPEQWQRLGLDAYKEGEDPAYRRLRAYWRKIGFVRISNWDERFALSPHWRLPSIEKLCHDL